MLKLERGLTPPSSSFSSSPLSTEGKVERLRSLVEHLETLVFQPEPSAKLVEMYLRAINELQSMQQLLNKQTEATVDEIIERLTSGNRIVVDDNHDDNAFGDRENPLE